MRGRKGELKTLRAESHLPLSPSCRLMESVENSLKKQLRTNKSAIEKNILAPQAGESLPPFPQPAIHLLFLSGFLSYLESKRKEAKEKSGRAPKAEAIHGSPQEAQPMPQRIRQPPPPDTLREPAPGAYKRPFYYQ